MQGSYEPLTFGAVVALIARSRRLEGRGYTLGKTLLTGRVHQMMDEFMQQPAHLQAGSPFAMEHMQRELERAASQRSSSPGWAAEFDPGMGSAAFAQQQRAQAAKGFGAADFARYQQLNASAAPRSASPAMQPPATQMGYSRPMGMGYMNGMGMGMGGMYAPMGFAGQQPQQQEPVQDSGKGKGRMVELDDKDWEQQFAALEQDQGAAAADELQQQRLDAEAEAAMERELNDLDRSVALDGGKSALGDFESVWRGIEADAARARALVDEDDFADPLQIDPWEGFDDLNTHANRDPHLGDYMFEPDNFFKDVSDPFAEGLRIMEEGGNLSLAALAFEAAVQKDPQHVQAWVKLGAAQAQNEKETPAIRALEQALKLDPANLEALMGLAVSYTNEGYDSTAYRTLERWLATKYPKLVDGPLSDAAEIGFTDRQALHDKVTDLFIKAAQLSPSGEAMDPDVQVGLGVLFYGAEEYDKAVDCFGAALASTESGTTNQQSQLHLLWNRLGATLANSGRSEEAIDAYERALALRPNFVRARYNLGVSCINIGCYAEAAQHLLGALAMHKVVEREGREKAREIVSGGGAATGDAVDEAELDRMILHNQSTNLFDTLRRVFSQMGRRDLGDMVGPGMDIDYFRREFEF